MDLETGKKIFYKYNGSHFYIDREVGAIYRKCKVPTEIEQVWLEDIIDSLKKKVAISKGEELVSATMSLTQLLTDNDAFEVFKYVLARKDIDTFSRLIVCEMLKNRSKSSGQQIKEVLEENQSLMVASPKTVDSSYRDNPLYKNLDFEQSIETRLPLLTQ